jgi:hypothetical protein
MPGPARYSDAGGVGNAQAPRLPAAVEFNRDIRPILSDNCFACHGPDKNKREADLRLDTEAGLLGSDGKPGAVVPGKPDDSELWRRITSADEGERMPPPEFHKELTDRDRQLIRRWIEQGAKWEGHWAFLPIKRPAAPTVDDARAPQSPIDAFVIQSLNEHGLKPAPEADRITLLRRLSFDLTGLPPDMDEVDRFLADQDARAYEHLVDRLLASPAFGERMAMWWLDLVRYADSVGYHGDQSVSIFAFREYVIEAFNSNKRFDRFTAEQLAGDLFPDASLEQKIASGYNRLGMMSAEGGVQPKEYLAKYIAERVRNASGTWLGVTLGCCECHDHKFDPFTTRDFYAFEAFFADINERGLYAGANADGNWGPFVKLPTAEQARRMAEFEQQISDVKKILDTTTPEVAAAQAEWEKAQLQWIVLRPQSVASAAGATLVINDDGSVIASGRRPETDVYTVTVADPPAGVTALRVELLPDDSLPKKGPGRAAGGNAVLTEFIAKWKPADAAEQFVELTNASATYEPSDASDQNPYKKWPAAAAIDGDVKGANWGWAVLEQTGRPNNAVFETKADVAGGGGSTLTIAMFQMHAAGSHTIGRFRLSASTGSRPVKAIDAPPANIATILAVAADQRTDAQKNDLAAHYRSVAPSLEPHRTRLKELDTARAALDKLIPSTLVAEATEPRMIRVLPRGNWMAETGDVMTPATPATLPPLRLASLTSNGHSTVSEGTVARGASEGQSAATPTRSVSDGQPLRRASRADLARWITAADNPLTARVFVNRLWKLYFGAGLSRKLDDLGAQGEWPSHPLLLDWLAAQFIDSGWDVKHVVKLMVMSNTYRQSSLVSTELRELDPYNIWLARQGRFRLDAEMIRDGAMATSGLLVRRVGGPSVRPYQPPGYWAYLNFPTREWENGNGDELYRRGLYTHWQRQYLHPSLLAFDAPCREECTADRPRSNTPLQSLVLLNDPTYVEAARAFAELILRRGGRSTTERLAWAFGRALSRPIKPAEAAVLDQLLDTHLADYRQDAAAASELLSVGARPMPADLDKTELAAWTSVARAILNLHEAITRN